MTNSIQFTATKSVVSNDTKTTVAASIEQLSTERQLWEDTVLRTTNDQLYELLQRCYAFYKSMEGTSKEATTRRDELNAYIKDKGYKFLKSTHTLQKIVRCVFGSDRRRISTYGIALRSVLEKKIPTEKVAAFIRQCGGVEEMRLAKAPNGMSIKDKAQFAAAQIVNTNIGVARSAALSTQLDVGKVGTNAVVIATWQADGSLVLRTVVESDTVLNSALASHYNAIKAGVKAQAEEMKAREVSTSLSDAVNDAAAYGLAA